MVQTCGDHGSRSASALCQSFVGRFQRGIVVNEYFEGDGAIIYKHASLFAASRSLVPSTAGSLRRIYGSQRNSSRGR
jgi:hypothetical protein